MEIQVYALLLKSWLRKISINYKQVVFQNLICKLTNLEFKTLFSHNNSVKYSNQVLSLSVTADTTLIYTSSKELIHLHYSSLGPLSNFNCALIDFCSLSQTSPLYMLSIYSYENKKTGGQGKKKKKSDRECFLSFMSLKRARP